MHVHEKQYTVAYRFTRGVITTNFDILNLILKYVITRNSRRRIGGSSSALGKSNENRVRGGLG